VRGEALVPGKLKMRVWIFAVWFLWFALTAPTVFAVERAPRISDREIIESLSELKVGQKALQQQINDLKESTQQQINDLKGSMQQQINDLKGSMQQQINDLKESTQQQIGSVQRQINDLQESTNRRFDVLQWMFGVFITLALAILSALWRILWHQQRRLSVIEASLETQKDEMAFIKGLIDKLLLARGVA